MEQNPLTLYELNALVKRSIHGCLPDTYWIQAELSDVRIHTSGHCYLEFIQKDPKGNQLIAKARGAIWNNVFKLLKPYFEEETGQAFVSGIKVLVQVSVEFHELYGYSLTVQDIDPNYTLGDMARKRREILRMLEEEGVLHLNKELELPDLPQRVAVISSATAAGYGDFCNQLHQNPYGLVFYPHLFPAIMQGERTEASIINALNQINEQCDRWDVVVIIRGGGATSDLSGFDTYELANHCAQFPLPIITGIGHERDDTVIDCVAHTRVKTPTAAAEFLINQLNESANLLERYAYQLTQALSQRLTKEKHRLNRLKERIPSACKVRLQQESHRQESMKFRWTASLQRRLTQEKHRIQLLEQRLELESPERLLKRGFSMTLFQGKIVKDGTELKPGDKLVTRLHSGEIESIIKEVKKK